MRKKQYGECVTCKWYDLEEHTCINRAGFYYRRHDFHPADTGCDMWQACELYAKELKAMKAQRILRDEDMIQSPWTNWAQRKRKEYQ